MLKRLFHEYLRHLEGASTASRLLITWFSEWRAILKKHSQYADIAWDSAQSNDFNAYWKNNYGRPVSNRWHQLYESHNGTFHQDYVPEHVYGLRIEPRLNPAPYARILADKSLTQLLYSGNPEVTFPETLLVGASGFLYDESRRIISHHEARAILNDAGEVFIKPITGGSSGRGVRRFRLQDGIDTLSGATVAEVLEQYKTDFIVQTRLTQHPAYAALHPDSINTVRITTFICSDSVAHWPVALRMGVSGRVVDNIHAGGLFVGISDEGRLNPQAYDQLGGVYTRHPTSGIVFSDHLVPFVNKVIAAAYSLHGKTPHIGIVSWDFSLDEAGHVVLIETNLWGQSIWIPQITHGKPAFGDHTIEILSLASTKGCR